MVTSDILCRTLRIKYVNNLATAFTIENDGHQFIVTAKHLFDNIQCGDSVSIGILNSRHYISINVIVMFHQDINTDCAVLNPEPYIEVTGKFPNENTMDGITLGQDVFFLGYPYNYDDILTSFPQTQTPVPFVKKACFSGVSESMGVLFLDGINNPGFSGGPVCFKDSKTNNYKIAGLINSYRNNKCPVFKNDGDKTDLYTLENTGIINACSIHRVFEIIEQNKDMIDYVYKC